MPTKFAYEAEIQAIRYVSKRKDKVILATLVPDWFSETPRNLVIAWLKNESLLSRTNLETYSAEQSLPFGQFFPSLDIIFGEPRDEPFEDTIKILEVKYSQRKLESVMKQITTVLFETDPMESAMKINDLIMQLTVNSRVQIRRIGDNISDEPVDLIKFSDSRRPKLNKLLIGRKNMIVIGGDSGMHKSNQAIDIIDAAVEHNVIELKNPNFIGQLFSKEMDYEEVEDRLVAKKMGWPLEDVTTKKGKWDKGKVDDYFQDPTKLKYIRDNFLVLGPEEFHNESDIIRSLVQTKASIWSLDFLQYYAQMASGNNASEQNVNVMRAIAFSKAIVQLTKTLGVIVSMVKKKAESRLSHFPRLDDLEWSGLTKQLAHSIGMCFWPYKIDQRKEKYVYFLSWQKVRKNDLFNEMLVLDPTIAKFTPMGIKDAAAWEYLREM